MAMEILRNVVLALHIIGTASLLGGALTQMKALKTGTARVVPAIMHGAWTMLATGLILVGMSYAMGNGALVNNAKIGVKTAILVVIVVIALVNRKKARIAGWVIPSLALLTIVNILLATVWQKY